MTDGGAPRVIVRACASALRTRPLRRFHRSLLRTRHGEALAMLGRRTQAIRDFDRALADTPGDETILADRAGVYEDRGLLVAADRDFTAAIASHVAIPANRTNGSSDILADYYAQRGRIRLRRGYVASAARDFARALAIDPAGATPQLRVLYARTLAKIASRSHTAR